MPFRERPYRRRRVRGSFRVSSIMMSWSAVNVAISSSKSRRSNSLRRSWMSVSFLRVMPRFSSVAQMSCVLKTMLYSLVIIAFISSRYSVVSPFSSSSRSHCATCAGILPRRPGRRPPQGVP